MVCAILIEKYRFILPEAAQLLNQVGYYLREQARYRAAGEYFQQALSISKQFGLDNYLETIINNLARLYFDTHRYTKASPLYEQALAIREQKLGSEDAAIAGALNHLLWRSSPGARSWSRGGGWVVFHGTDLLDLREK